MAQQIKRYLMMRGVGPISCRHRGLLASLLLLLAAAAPAQERVDSSHVAQQVRALKPGEPIEKELAGGETHVFQITAITGQYLHFVVTQLGIDVVVKLLGPDGKLLTEVDGPTGATGDEPVVVITALAGMYRAEVHALEPDAAPGRYQITLKELRPAAPPDHDHLAADQKFAEGTSLYDQRTPEARRQAITKYEAAAMLWQKLGDNAAQGKALNMIGHINSLLGENKQAFDYFNRALSLRRAGGDSAGVGQTLNNLGDYYRRHGQLQRALDYLQQSLQIRTVLNDQLSREITLTNIGSVYSEMGDLQQALQYYEQALPLTRTTNDRFGEANTLNSIGLVHDRIEEKQKALEYYEQALALWRADNEKYGEGHTLNNIGKVYGDLGDFHRSLTYLEQALVLRRVTGDRQGENMTLNNMGYAYANLNDWAKAREYFEQALQLAIDLGNRRTQAYLLNNLGRAYSESGETGKALDHCEQALALTRAVGDRALEARVLSNTGGIYFKAGEFSKALACYEQTLPLHRAVRDRSGEASTLLGMASVERARGNLEAARVRAEAVLAIAEALRSKVGNQELRTSYAAAAQNYYEFYIDLLMQMHRNQPAEKHDAAAFQMSERYRARSLLETLGESRAAIRKGVDSVLLAREQLLQQQVNVKAGRLTQMLSGNPQAEQAAAAKKEVEALLLEYQNVQTRIRLASPRYAALTQPQPLSITELQRQVLDDDTMLLEYTLGPKRSFLWAVTPATITGFVLPGRAEIDSLARRVYDHLTARNRRLANETPTQRRTRLAQADAEYLKAAAALSQILLAPIINQIGTKRLLVVADGALQYIPFGALPMPVISNQSSVISKPKTLNTDHRSLNTDYRPLALDHEIVSLPSASVLAVLRRELAGRPSASKTVAVLADPVFTSDDPRVKSSQMIVEKKISEPIASLENSRMLEGELERTARDFELRDTTGLEIPRLPFSRQEGEGIVSKLPVNENMKALDFAASRAAATSKELSQYRIVHFATHGLLNSVHPELSGIVLSLVNENGEAQDGFLRLHEIYNLNLPADLVVLSACQTALGKEIKGEGLVGLTRGFMYAGAARVVASLWKVDDEATAELMKRFYQKMLGPEKLRPAAALRAAQVSMWKEKRWQAPYYWAAFVLQGEWK